MSASLFDMLPTEISSQILDMRTSMWRTEHKTTFKNVLSDISRLRRDEEYDRILNIMMDEEEVITSDELFTLLTELPDMSCPCYLPQYHQQFTNLMQAAHDTGRLFISAFRAGPDYGVDVEVDLAEEPIFVDDSAINISRVSHRDEDPMDIQTYLARAPKSNERVAIVPMESEYVLPDVNVLWNVYIVVPDDGSNPRLQYL